MTFDLPLCGAGGEPVDFSRTINSHGLIMLAPNTLLEAENVLSMPLRLSGGRSTVVTMRQVKRGLATVTATGARCGARPCATNSPLRVRRILHLDADYSAFYKLAALDPELRWVTRGAGRFVHSATAFEDVVKTICTTNCAWSATIRMTDALVTGLGEPVAGVPGARLFPTPQAMAKASEAWYRDVARTGYRGAYLRAIAAAVVRGEIDLEALAETPSDVLPDDTLEEQLLELPGVGPVRGGPHHDADGPLFAPHLGFGNAPEVRAPQRTQTPLRCTDRPPLQTLRPLRRSRVLVLRNERLARR